MIAKDFPGRVLLVEQTVRRTSDGKLLYYSRDPTWANRATVYIDVRPVAPVPRSHTYMEIQRASRNVGEYEVESGGFLWRGTAGFVYPASGYTEVDGNHDSVDALRRMSLSKLGSGDFNAGQFIGELRQSVGMVAKRLGQVTDAAAALTRGHAPSIAAALAVPNDKVVRQVASLPPSRRLADGWLELQYGWKPLLSDTYAAIDTFRSGLTRERGSTISSSVGKRHRPPKRGSFVASGLTDPSDLGPLASRASTTGIVVNPGIRTLNELGLLNPLSLAWELLPYSFVVDWALPIGEILTGLSATAGLSGVYTSVVTERRWVTRLSPSGVWTQVDQQIIRTPFNEGAPFDIATSLQKVTAPHATVMANAVALLAQQFHRNRVSIIH